MLIVIVVDLLFRKIGLIEIKRTWDLICLYLKKFITLFYFFIQPVILKSSLPYSPGKRIKKCLTHQKCAIFRSDIQAEQQASIQFDIDVTTYEGKLGDPKVEEPLIQASRPLVEPEKIKTIPDKKNKVRSLFNTT